MEATVLAAISVVINWWLNLMKDVTNKNWNGVLTRVVALVVAIITVMTAAHQSIPILGSINLQSLNGGAQLGLALFGAASAGTVTDVLRTFNRADVNVQPKLAPSLASIVPKQPTDQAA